MFDIYRNDSKKTTTAVAKGTKYDAFKHITKKMGLDFTGQELDESDEFLGLFCPNTEKEMIMALKLDKAVMVDKCTATVTLDPEDADDEAVAESEAVKKAMSNHKASFNKAIKRWMVAILNKIKAVNPEIFAEAVKQVQ